MASVYHDSGLVTVPLDVDPVAVRHLDEVLVTPPPRWELARFAEARGRGVARIRTGVVVLDDWAVTGHRALPAGTVFERAARRVLRGHPARRRYRLR